MQVLRKILSVNFEQWKLETDKKAFIWVGVSIERKEFPTRTKSVNVFCTKPRVNNTAVASISQSGTK
jgi:hypothetical protein